ncbi:hypothetical protein [Leifsonia sp. AG29]|uniref:hypothetical protein n=1 Tax=Leifsonia sp. AG29 TaxID=2598860 RepID=UPI00131B52DF|nr:hypothetical protein [Leifsonia sp. AG29]
MPDTHTTEGSIVAYLRLDKSDWDRKLDEAEARARELGRTDPNIKVNADVAEAMAKIEALRAAEGSLTGVNVGAKGGSGASKIDEVTAAQNRLTAAEAASEVATQRAIVAQMRLDERRDKTRMTDGQLAAAELGVQVAIQRSEAAAARAATAEDALTAAKARQAEESDRSAVAALREAAALEADRNATDKAAQSNQNNVGRLGLVVAGIAAAIPLASQLAGAAVGIAGGMAGMGAAGVLAILGIKQQMQDGTQAGNEYRAGLQILQGDLQQLETTASSGVLNGFDRSLSAVHDELPALNDEIRVFSGELGTAASVVTTGVVTALRVMNPLFVQAGFYVEQLAAGFTHWTQDGGLAKFTQDAITSLPQVTQALGNLLHGILDLIQAFSPLGPVLLGTISLIGNLLSLLSMLGPAFPPILAGAIAAFTMFMKWEAIAPVLEDVAWRLGAVGVAADIASGPVGWIIGAASLLAAGLVGIAVGAGQATQATEDYTAAVQQDNGVIGQHVQAQAADNLQKSGALDLAKKLNISTKELTAATTTDDAARQKLISTLQKQVDAGYKIEASGYRAIRVQTDQGKAAQELIGKLNGTHGAISSQIQAYNDVAQAQGQSTISSAAQLRAAQALAATYGMSVPQMLAAKGAQQQNADQAAATTRQLQFENDAATLLTNAFTLLNGGMLSVAQAQTGAAAAGNTLLDSLKQNGTAIDGNSKAAVANQQALEQKVAADQQAAEAIAKQTGSTEAGTKAFAASKQALIDQLTATGQLTPAIQALIDKYYAVPPVVKTQAELDADAASAKLAAFKAELASIHDQTVTLTVVTNNVGAPAQMPANTTGGAYKFAHGGDVMAYRASGGPMNYLAVGGHGMWQPQGTDMVPAMLTEGEFVVKEKSASYDPQFMKAYNDNPAAALASVGPKSGDRPIFMDGSLFGVLREMANGEAQIVVNQAAARQRAGLRSGMQKVAY